MFSKKQSVEGVWDDNPNCTTCLRPFTLLRRQHHCRRCGGAFCNTCSQHRLLLSSVSRSGRSKRVCTPCFNSASAEAGAGGDDFAYSVRLGSMSAGGSLGGGGGKGSFSGRLRGTSSGGGGGGGGSFSDLALRGGELPTTRGSQSEAAGREDARQSIFGSFSAQAVERQQGGGQQQQQQQPLPPHLRGFPKEGVSLEGIKGWVATRGGADTFREQTTADVVTRHILPCTSPGSPLLKNLPQYHAGEATVHVCHAWGGKFLKVIAALEAWEEGLAARGALPSPPHYWLDVFVQPLHAPASHSWEFLRETYAPGVAGIGKSVLILDPEAPLPLRRTWCLFECGAALTAPSGPPPGAAPLPRLDIALPPGDAARLKKALARPGGLEAACAALTARLDVGSSECGRAEDRRRLLKAFREGPFPAEVTERALRGVLGAFLLQAARAHLSGFSSPIARTPLQCAIARVLLRTVGDAGAAEDALREALVVMEPIVGEAHPRVIHARSDLAAACSAQGKVREAEGHCRAALAGAAAAAALGAGGGSGGGGAAAAAASSSSSSSSAASSGGGMGGGSGASGGTSAGSSGGGGGGGGEEFFFFVVEELARAQCSLADCLVAQRKLGEAELLYRQALNARRSALGGGHAMTLEALVSLAKCVSAVGPPRGKEALALLREAYETSRKALDEASPTVLAAGDALGDFFYSSSSGAGEGEGEGGGEGEGEGEGENAFREGFFASALLTRRRCLGDAHPATLRMLVAQGRKKFRDGDMHGASCCFEEALKESLDDSVKGAILSFCGALSKEGKVEDSEAFLSTLFDSRN
jgi:hypothetical protein